MKNKRGFELSLNMIIIVILAIAFLGVGLWFVMKLTDIDIQVPQQCEVNPPTAEHPICIQSNIDVSRAKQYKTTIAFYNNEEQDITPDILPEISCSSNMEGGNIGVTSTAAGMNVPVGEIETYILLFKISSNAPNGVYPCIIKISDTEKQFTFSVN